MKYAPEKVFIKENDTYIEISYQEFCKKQRKSLGIRSKFQGCGAGGGIRTPVGFHPNGFQDRLVMTASIRLHAMQFFNAFIITYYG